MREKGCRRPPVRGAGAWLRSLMLAGSVLAGCTDEVIDALDFGRAPSAKQLALVEFEEPVFDTVAAGPYAFLLHESSGFRVIELGDSVSDKPNTYGPFATAARVLAVEYDEASRVAYLVDAAGNVLVVDLSASAAIRVVSTLSLSSLASNALGTEAQTSTDKSGGLRLARSGKRLFVLKQQTLQPIALNKHGQAWSLSPERAVSLARSAKEIAVSSGKVFLGYEADGQAEVEVWSESATGALSLAGRQPVGGKLMKLISRGDKTLVLSKKVGLSVIDFYRPAKPKMVYQSDAFRDVSDARLFGRTLLVGLEDREFVSTVDISNFSAPAVLTTNKGKLPAWFSLVRGNLFMGSGMQGTVNGVEPVFAASVPTRIRDAFPLNGQIPLTFSKQIDPASVTPGALKLTCDGKEVGGTPWLSPDGFTVNFRALADLPSGKKCTLDFSALSGFNGLALARGEKGTRFEFTTIQTPIVPKAPGSSYPHTADGKFTDCALGDEPQSEADAGAEPSASGEEGVQKQGGDRAACEWFDVQPAQGRYTYFYADFDGQNLWLLNDWFYNGENIDPDCYNQFQVWTGGGAERWEIRAYGDQHVEVTRNGEQIDTSSGVEGGAYYGPSPNVAEPHTIYELKIPAQPGSWGVQLHDPGPTFACNHLEADTVPFSGSVTAGAPGGTVSGSATVSLPLAPAPLSPIDGALEQAIDPLLSWGDSNGIGNYAYYQLQIASDPTFTNLVLNRSVWSTRYNVSRGLLQGNTTYYWRVIAQNSAGSSASSTFRFTTTATPEYFLSVGLSGQGTVSSSDLGRNLNCTSSGGGCQTSYASGSQVTLTASAADGWTFSGWAGACSGSEPTTQVTLSGDQYCFARFSAPNGASTLWVSRQGNGSGTVTSVPSGVSCGADCNETYANGTRVTLQANAAQGSIFAGWSGDCASWGMSTTGQLDIHTDQYCSAIFRVPQIGSYTLSVWPGEGGAIVSDVGAINCPSSSCQAAYAPGTQVTLTASALPGYSFAGWTGDCQAAGNSPTAAVTLNGYRSCNASFVSDNPRLNVYVSGTGNVSSSPAGIQCGSNGTACVANFPRGTQVTLTAQSSVEGAVFSGWSGDCQGTSPSVTVDMSAARSCTATFAQTSLSVGISGRGTVTSNSGGIRCENGGGTCSANFAPGTQVTLSAAPAQGYRFSGWSGGCRGQEPTTSVSVSGATYCTATFTTNTLTVYVTGSGTVSSSPAGISCSNYGGNGCSVNYATSAEVQLTAVASQDFVFTGWSGCVQSESASITVNVESGANCFATFVSNNNPLTLGNLGNGNGSVTSEPSLSCTFTGSSGAGTCSASFDYNQTVTLTANPGPTDTFTGWSGHCSGTGTTTSVTMTGARTCYATFAKNRLSLGISGQGSISSEPGTLSCSHSGGTCSNDFAPATQVSLTAEPAPNYKFSNWSGCSNSTSATISITMNAAQSCTANFTTNTLSIAFGGNGQGAVTSSPGTISCTKSGAGGAGAGTCSTNLGNTEVVLTATPATGSFLSSWQGACGTVSGNTATINLTGNVSCGPVFTLQTYEGVVSVTGRGGVTSSPSGISCGGDCSGAIPVGTSVTMTAIPFPGETFLGWGGACAPADNDPTFTFPMPAQAVNCTATFSNTQPGGTFAGTFNVLQNDAAQCTGWNDFRSSLSESHVYDRIRIRGSRDTTGVTCTGPSANTICQALRTGTAISPVTCDGRTWNVGACGTNPVELHAGPHSSVCGCGGEDHYTVRPCYTNAVGYNGIGNACATGVTNQTIEVECTEVDISLTVTGEGTVTSIPGGIACPGDCSANFEESAIVELTATPAQGQTFEGWGGDCEQFGTDTTIEIDTDEGPIDCTATFSVTPKPRVLIAASDDATATGKLRTALLATDAFTSVDVASTTSGVLNVPSVQAMQEYDVVLVWTNTSMTSPAATTFGNNLADYYDEGGRVVVASLALGGYSFRGRFANPANGYVLLDTQEGDGECSGTTLGTVAEPASALMNDVTSVTIADLYGCALGGVVNGGSVVASYTGGTPMVVRGTVEGRARVDLNLWPSEDNLGGDAVTLIKNALLYR